MGKARAALDLEAENAITPEDEWGESAAAEDAASAMMERFPAAYRPEGFDDE